VVRDKVIISNKDEVYVHVLCDEDIAHELREHFTFHVPGYQFTPQYRAKLWDGRIRLFDLRTRIIYRGLVQYIIKFCEDREYSWSYDNEIYDQEFSVKEAQEFIKILNLPVEPRDYQLDSFIHAVRMRRTLLLSPTASGKSLIIYLITRYVNAKRTLIIVPNISLVTQLTSDFADYGLDADKHVHRIFAGQDKETDKKIVISTWQSLYKLPKSYFDQFELVIGDECHLYKSKEITGLMTKMTNAKYRVGTTGTLDGTKTSKLVLEGLFGPVKKVITTKDLMDKGHVADFNIKCLLLKYPSAVCQALKSATYQQEIEYLVLNENRNKFISNLALSLKNNTLILYQYVDKHGKILYEMINKQVGDRKCFFVYGKTDGEVREEIRHIVEKEKDAIIVASYGVFSTGVSIRNLHNIIFASPSKSRIRNLQSIGRGLRKSETKDSATLYDIADDLRYKKRENYTLKHFAHRIQIYSEEKFQFKIYKIELGT
jgi:superfamily II DNA or RNA helicase